MEAKEIKDPQDILKEVFKDCGAYLDTSTKSAALVAMREYAYQENENTQNTLKTLRGVDEELRQEKEKSKRLAEALAALCQSEREKHAKTHTSETLEKFFTGDQIKAWNDIFDREGFKPEIIAELMREFYVMDLNYYKTMQSRISELEFNLKIANKKVILNYNEAELLGKRVKELEASLVENRKRTADYVFYNGQIKKRIEDLEASNGDKWVSVEERLPEEKDGNSLGGILCRNQTFVQIVQWDFKYLKTHMIEWQKLASPLTHLTNTKH